MQTRRPRRLRMITLIVILSLAASIPVLADSDCWCAQYVDLQHEVPTRNSIVILRIAASLGLTAGTFWAVDALGLPNPQWYKVGALVSGLSNTASALVDLMIPTERELERDAERIADSTLSEDLCEETIADYKSRVSTHRYIKGGIGLASGASQLLLLGPGGVYSTGDIYDYVYLITGGIDIVGGAIGVLFPTRFEMDYRDAVDACDR